MGDKKGKWNIKCAVYGCSNESHQGDFNGPVCMPCWNMITTGNFSHGKTIFHAIKEERDVMQSRIMAMGEKLAKIENIVLDEP